MMSRSAFPSAVATYHAVPLKRLLCKAIEYHTASITYCHRTRESVRTMLEAVFVPPAVYAELTDARAPERVRQRVLSLPKWFEVRTRQLTSPARDVIGLHRGEREAMLLAESLSADVLLRDEQTGRAIAMGRKLPLSGTLGVLESADAKGLLNDFPLVLKQLRASGFFIAESSERKLLQRHRARRGTK